MNDKQECIEFQNGYPCFVPAQRILHLISNKWAIQLIHLLGKNRKLRYNELKEELQKGWKKNKISDATLSSRLSELVDEGLLIKKVYPELPPKVVYSLSKKGLSLSKALQPVIQWTIDACHEKMDIE